MKNSSDTIGNRTRDLQTCSTVPQPTEPPRASSRPHIATDTSYQLCKCQNIGENERILMFSQGCNNGFGRVECDAVSLGNSCGRLEGM